MSDFSGVLFFHLLLFFRYEYLSYDADFRRIDIVRLFGQGFGSDQEGGAGR